MKWNWQKKDWPRFSWDKARLAAAEEKFVLETGVFTGAFKHLPREDREQIVVEAISTEALRTSEIEGEILDRTSVQSSIRRYLGLAVDTRRAKPAEQGIAEMMVDLYRRFDEPLTHRMLFAWNLMLLRGQVNRVNIGAYRTGEEPMQVVSGRIDNPTVHFEAPPSSAVPSEMRDFVQWFNGTAPGADRALPAVTRAGIAHLYFVSIHPFEDGNGRIARALAEKSLAQGRGAATLIALADTILARRKQYYKELEAANKENEITDWLVWFAGTAIEAQRRAVERVGFLIAKTRLLDGLRGQLNARQDKAILRMLGEGPDGFEGGLSAGNYISITGASQATATRDLANLVALGALVRSGAHRYARYRLALPVHDS
jgi:Fic family protein